MATKLKNLRIEEDFIQKVQLIANESFEGNFTAALIDCARSGVSMRKIPEHVREDLKAGGVRRGGRFHDFYIENPRTVVDALQI